MPQYQPSFFRLLAENSPLFIGMCDMNYEPFYVNEAGCRLVGLDNLGHFAETPVREFFFPEDQDFIVNEFFPRVLREGRAETEIRFRHFKTGEAIWMTYDVFFLADKHGKAVGLATVSRDISERKRAEAALRLADQRKDEFLATLAHELRNPLAPIHNATHVLRKRHGEGDPDAPLLDMIGRHTAHLVRLVDDLLEISRISSGKVELHRESAAVMDFVREALETCQALIDRKCHSVVVKSPGAPLFVFGDPTRLAQIAANIINNAAKYTPTGGRIEIEVAREDDEAVVRVRDNGVGIDADMMPRIFDLFEQTAGQTRLSEGGLGIGLALVRKLAELHGGSVEAKSEGVGRGSEFIVRLPLRSACG